MAPIKLHYQDRYRLWADLLQGHTDRLFVATEERPSLGATVPLQIHVSELALPIVALAKVVGWRGESARFPRGVFVQVPEEELEKCRRFLGLSKPQPTDSFGRALLRLHTRAPVRLLGLGTPLSALARNVSEGGLLIETDQPLVAGQQLELALSLTPGEPPFIMRAEVAWSYADRKLVGFKLVDVAPELASRLRQAIETQLAAQERDPSRPLPILVADDDPGILKFLASALARHSGEVYQATNGEEAIRLARAIKPALVVMDILMPNLDGADVCKAMRADAELVDVPVIFVSALDPKTLHQVADSSGATDYIVKPVALTDLFNLVGRYLRRAG